LSICEYENSVYFQNKRVLFSDFKVPGQVDARANEDLFIDFFS